MATDSLLTRRELLSGRLRNDNASQHHVSSAVLRVLPAAIPDLREQLATMHGVDLVAAEDGKIVIVLEGLGPGELGEKLTQINLMPGVLAASMVFEQAAPEEATRHDDGTQPA